MPSTRACSGPPRTGILRGARCSFGPLYRELRSSSDLDHSQTIAHTGAVSNILAVDASSIGDPGLDQQQEVGDAPPAAQRPAKATITGLPWQFLERAALEQLVLGDAEGGPAASLEPALPQQQLAHLP